MIWILGITIICIFITFWMFLMVCESNTMSLSELLTGKDKTHSNSERIKELEKRINELEEAVFIVPRG